MNEEEIRQRAIEFARKNRERIAEELTDPTKYKPDPTPVSIFMAGSPGAGKTEYSKNLIKLPEGIEKDFVVRIDPDELREYFPGYTGNNSYLFHGAVSLVVEKMHDLVLKQSQTFILDGTLAHYDKAIENIQRSLKKGRKVFIFYIYQKPEVAWKFTEARERAEGRNIPKTAFVEQFLEARNTVRRVINELGDEVKIFLVKKDFQTHAVEYAREVGRNSGNGIDDLIAESYTQDELNKLFNI